jgi:hypothetical protein
VLQAWFGLQTGATILLEFDGADSRPSRPPTPGDKKATERLPIFVGNEVVVVANRNIVCQLEYIANECNYSSAFCVLDAVHF